MQDPTAFQAMKPHFPELEQLKSAPLLQELPPLLDQRWRPQKHPRSAVARARTPPRNARSLTPDPSRVNPTRKFQEPSHSHPQSLLAATSSQEAGGSGGSDGDPGRIYGLPVDQDHKMLDISGSFSSLLASTGGLGSVLDGLNPNGSGLKMVPMGGFGESFNSGGSSVRTSGLDLQGNNVGGGESYMQTSGGGGGGGGGGDSSCWSSGGNGWPDLAIYTPGSNFQ
ncbi:hypothetical protein Patl1_33408 [Pistacia atlantica]|uniref:Uncharacterized protein n=1 Tax=Pistacia atlantica TaxID=434234 RepID=A0ACC0ZRY3_9ROSI|nr:hypothetical protein Patl1_33408 [Pistacia atlantica]